MVPRENMDTRVRHVINIMSSFSLEPALPSQSLLPSKGSANGSRHLDSQDIYCNLTRDIWLLEQQLYLTVCETAFRVLRCHTMTLSLLEIILISATAHC